METIFTRFLSRLSAAFEAAALVLLMVSVPAVHAQQKVEVPQSTSAYSEQETQGSVTEPKGNDYIAPNKLNPKLARVTFYRPVQGLTAGVASISINGHYHTSLQLGGYSEICLEPGVFALAAHMVQTGGELKNYQDATVTLKPQTGQNLYVRVIEYGDGRATLTPVRNEDAKSELKNTRRQIHATNRVEQAQECFESAPKVVKKESIILGADALFGFGKSDIEDISAKGRDSLEQLVAHLKKEYGQSEDLHIQIVGHADPLGSHVSNKRLSEARALAIRTYLIQDGMSEKGITATGVGSAQPVIKTCGKTATPENIECNKPNRRVVVNVQELAR